MKKLIAVLSVMMMAVPALASRHQTSLRTNWSTGLQVLQDIAEIPGQRYDSLNCWQANRHNPNRDLCMIESYRLDTAEHNIDIFSGNLHFVKQAINSDINERNQRMSNLSCWRNNSNRDLCRYEEGAISELRHTHLSRINRAINNDRARDRDRHRIPDRSRDRAREREVERRERERERSRRRRRGRG